jgi:uncharacterized glyoxalase superfamily protein PhnB
MSAPTTGAAFYPTIRYRDPVAAMIWLEEALGFERREDHRDADGTVAHAELALGGAIVMLATAGAGREPFKSLPAGVALVYCATEDVDALYERVQARGADIASEITDTDYGSRDFTVRDPEGNLWAFGTYRPAA